GVAQRVRLQRKGADCDVLTMTATPIPRSLALTIYGATDISAIDEMPPGRLPVDTRHFKRAKRETMYRFVRERVAAGEQAYIVCPLIDESETVEAAAATSLVEELRAGPLADARIEMLHGRMSIDQKDAVMKSFKTGEIDVIVGTTVVEVGIDVPNATIMVIEEAGRFGLAQLHQLRGRVGRGGGRAYCFLVDDAKTDTARARIDIVKNTTDGFKIAEEDLRMRGPGEITGMRQSGYSSLRLADISSDMRLVESAREYAFRIISADPELVAPKHAAFRRVIETARVHDT
ncbi:MAG: DNA helicase RecG, partial [Candidatus Hydrogenedentes bacterium]|nr:DNA helicase RecG [Candidatus Hydrogenedentota bacterium]